MTKLYNTYPSTAARHRRVDILKLPITKHDTQLEPPGGGGNSTRNGKIEIAKLSAASQAALSFFMKQHDTYTLSQVGKPEKAGL